MSDSPLQAGTVDQRVGTDPDGIQSMHDILSCWERRALLYYLQEREDPAGLRTVSAHLAGWRRGNEGPSSDDEAIVDTRRELRREHLRKMEEFGVVWFDPGVDDVGLVDGMTVAVSKPWRHHDDAVSETDLPTGDDT